MTDQNSLVEMLIRCTRCPDMCACACPVFDATKNQADSPSNKLHIAGLLHKGDLSPRAEMVEILYQCTNCRLCKEWCIYDDIDLPTLLKGVRTGLIASGHETALPSFVKEILSNTTKNGTPYPNPDNNVVEALNRERSEEGEVLFFAGCTTRAFHPEIAASSRRVLEAMGVQTIFLPEEEPCCGGPLADLGFEENARSSALAVRDYIMESDCSLVLSNCPRCVYGMTEGLSQFGLTIDVPIMQMTTYLSQKLEESDLDFSHGDDSRVVLDDDPYMARYLKLVDPPRNILQSMPGIELVEMFYNKEKANPSSCYLGTPDPVTARRITANWLESAERTGAERIITTSPFGKRDLTSIPSNGAQVLDVMELAEERLVECQM